MLTAHITCKGFVYRIKEELSQGKSEKPTLTGGRGHKWTIHRRGENGLGHAKVIKSYKLKQ